MVTDSGLYEVNTNTDALLRQLPIRITAAVDRTCLCVCLLVVCVFVCLCVRLFVGFLCVLSVSLSTIIGMTVTNNNCWSLGKSTVQCSVIYFKTRYSVFKNAWTK